MGYPALSAWQGINIHPVDLFNGPQLVLSLSRCLCNLQQDPWQHVLSSGHRVRNSQPEALFGWRLAVVQTVNDSIHLTNAKPTTEQGHHFPWA